MNFLTNKKSEDAELAKNRVKTLETMIGKLNSEKKKARKAVQDREKDLEESQRGNKTLRGQLKASETHISRQE